MAAKKSKENPHQWPNGTWHSRPYYGGDGKKNAAPSKPKAPAAPPPPAPVAPTAVAGFFTGDDLAAINDFNTRYATDLAGLDAMLADLATDTAYQKDQTNKQAKEHTAAATDNMAARGLFRSSIKDAALYDVEAQRTLATKFLDDKMTAATLNAGTQKQILAGSKQRFDEAMLARQGENAAAVNDAATATWSDLMATWQQKYGGKAPAIKAPAAATVPPAAAQPAKPLSPYAPNQNAGWSSTYNKRSDSPKPAKKLAPNKNRGVGNAR